MTRDARYWIRALALLSHPEGGYYREVYRSAETVEAPRLPERFDGPRSFATSIFFLLEGMQVSHLHRIRSDELWHFHAGAPLEVFVIDPAGEMRTLLLGPDPERGQAFLGVVPAGSWFGAALERPDPAAFALVGCTVAPGFDFADFELADGGELLARFPQHAEAIRRLT